MHERRPMSIEWLAPEWSAPARVRAACTLRSGGVSAAPYASLNLAAGVGDEPGSVAENRRRLRIAVSHFLDHPRHELAEELRNV